MHMDARFLRVVGKHARDGSHGEGGPAGGLALTSAGIFFEHHPHMIGTRGSLNPDFREIQIQESHESGRQMDESVPPRARLGTCTILIVWTEAHLHAVPTEIEILQPHAQQFPEAKAALFEEQADQPIAKTSGIRLR